jgi:clan AA aspartic protease (TIGR02281 family)
MAFRGGMRRAMSEAGLWLAVAGTSAVSFYFFEDAYRVVEKSWPKLQTSFAPGAVDPGGTISIGRQDNTASLPEPASVAELRPTDTGLTELVQSISRPIRRVTMTANSYGHFVVQAEINGARVELLTDTGATYVALNYDTAIKLGFDPKKLDFSSRSSTANGIARVAPVDLAQVRIGSIVLKDVKAVIAEPGKMTQNLLGMSFIRRLSGFELTGEMLSMTQN